MNNPLFSIVMPTKDRPQVLNDSLDSCLAQTLGDFEVIVVDNSADAGETNKVVSAYKDPRIKYMRTGGLSMPDNWDVALRQGIGRYVYIMADKLILSPVTLEHAARGIECTGLDVLGFRDHSASQFKPLNQLKWNVMKTAPFIEEMASGKLLYPGTRGYHLRGYGLFLSRKYLEMLLKKFGRIAIPVSPDYTMGFFTILNCSELAFCDEALYKASEKYASNGMSFLYGGELSKQFLKELGKSEEYWLEYVPLKIVETMNTVFNDQIRVCKICGIEPRMERSELMAYWKEMYSTLCMIESFYHIDQTDNFRKCYNFAEENSFILDPEIWKHMKEEAIVRYSRLPPPHDHIAKPAERK